MIALQPGETTIEPEISYTIKLLKILGNKKNIDILKVLSTGTKTYNGLHADLNKTTSKGMMAFCLRKLKREQLIKLDKLHQQYNITFKGIKSLELFNAANIIANLSLSELDKVNEDVFVKLTQNQNWLEPLIKSYMQNTKQGERQS